MAINTRDEGSLPPQRALIRRVGALTGARQLVFGDGTQWIALLLTVFAVAPLFYPSFFQSHSGLLPVYNLYELESHSALSAPGWVATVGQAFDPFRAGRSLPYTAAEVFHWLGVDAPQAIMASYALSFLVAAWAMYRWVRSWLGSESALLAAALYTYFPYHLATVYVRGELAEAWLLAMLPVVFWAASGLGVARRRKLRLILTLMAFGLLCLTNLGLALMFGPALVGYIWLRGGLGKRWGAGITAAAVLGVVLVAHLAAGIDSPYVVFEAHFPYLFQFFSAAWNASGQSAGWLNALPLQIGLPLLGLSLLAVLLLGLKGTPEVETATYRVDEEAGSSPRHSEQREESRLLCYWLVVAVLSFALMWSPLSPLWQLAGWRYLLTYPWQMMGLLGLCLSIFAGAAVALDSRLRTVTVQAGLVTFVVLSSYSYLAPRFFDFNIDFTPEGKAPHAYLMAPRQAPLAIFGDNQVALLDFKLEGPLRHGATVRLNVLWQALRPLKDDFMVFVHVLDEEENIWGQRDVELLDGERPTSQWGEGEIVANRYEFQIGLEGPREGYHLAIGLYHPETGERLLFGGHETSLLLRGE